MPVTFQIQGLDAVIKKFGTLPKNISSTMRKLMDKSLRVLWENVPPYPPKPETSKYIRTGMLGHSLGSGGGKPTVYSVKGTGADIVGTFGTKLSYAKYVVDPERQAYMHKGRWWTMKTILDNSEGKIKAIWDTFIKILLG